MPHSMIEALEAHWQICQDCHKLSLEENQLLKQGSFPPAEFLEKKRTLLVVLDESIERLRLASQTLPAGRKSELLEWKRKTAQKIQQILLLDRENEKLLLGLSIPGQKPPAQDYPNAGKIKSLYEANRR